MPAKKYIVDLKSEERAKLLELTRKGNRSVRKVRRARILLKADEGWKDREIMVALDTRSTTVERTRKRFVEGGLEKALNEDPRPGQQRKLECVLDPKWRSVAEVTVMSVLDPSVISRIDVRRTAVDAVTDPLRTAIVSGRIRPGQTLRQGEIAQEFGVSRTPVRQALRILHREGLVDLEPHRMAGVSAPSADAVEESFVIRAVLEAEVAKRAVPD